MAGAPVNDCIGGVEALRLQRCSGVSESVFMGRVFLILVLTPCGVQVSAVQRGETRFERLVALMPCE